MLIIKKKTKKLSEGREYYGGRREGGRARLKHDIRDGTERVKERDEGRERCQQRTGV